MNHIRQREVRCDSSKLITQRTSGVTLVEVTVALMIILTTATAIFASFIAANNYTGRAKRRIIAINFGRQKLEELKPYARQDTWDNAPTGDPLTNGLALTGGSWTTYENLPGTYNATWQMRRRYKVSPVGSQDCRQVTVELEWIE